MAYVINRDFCSCCHMCKVYCPVGAVSFRGSKYWIDPDKCIDCGTCAELCHNSVISNPDKPDPAPKKHALRKLSADLVVLGAGGAGLIAAVKAATSGVRKVIVLEKAKKIGGNTYYAGGFRISYSKLEKDAGISDKRDQKLLEFMMNIRWQADHHVARSIQHATEHLVDWMMAECGSEHDFALRENPFAGFDISVDNSSAPAPKPKMTQLIAPRTVNLKGPDGSIGPGSGGTYVVDKMLAMCQKLNIPVMTQHRAVELLRDKSGIISGVLADDPGGQTKISCKAVVLACGGFSHNDELLLRACPDFYDETEEPIHKFSVPTCTGDGLLMAEKIGAKIDMVNVKVPQFGPAHHPFGFAVLCMTREPESILVNKYGKRWACEVNNTMAIRHLFKQQPGGLAYYIADQNLLDLQAKHLIKQGKGDHRTALISRYMDEIEEELTLDKPAKRADTLENLAEQIDLPVDDFVAEIKKYNKFCKQGFDEDFFKDPKFLIPIEKPPFYAFFAKRFHENASGGVTIDSLARVVSSEGPPIQGLYACGDTARGIRVKGDVGIDVVESFISDCTSACGTGYMAGEAAAAYISG